MAKPKIACQLIIFGKDAIQNNLPQVIRTLAEAGYAGAETGYLGDQIEAADLKKLLDDNNLASAGVHGGFQLYRDECRKMIDFAAGCGAKYLICSGVGDRKQGIAAYESAAEVFNKVGEQCKNAGIEFCYHNHSWEFEKFDGKAAIYRLYELTDPNLVKLCVDTYWVQHGGEDPADFLQRHLDRLALVHLKDMKKEPEVKDGVEYPFAEVGQGILDWRSILDVCLKANLEWLTVEQDRTTGDAIESVRISRDYLKREFDL